MTWCRTAEDIIQHRNFFNLANRKMSLCYTSSHAGELFIQEHINMALIANTTEILEQPITVKTTKY